VPEAEASVLGLCRLLAHCAERRLHGRLAAFRVTEVEDAHIQSIRDIRVQIEAPALLRGEHRAARGNQLQGTQVVAYGRSCSRSNRIGLAHRSQVP
jgi:hypothetical protein